MVGRRTLYGIPIADTFSPAMIWKVSERFGNGVHSADALYTLADAKTAIIRVAAQEELALAGWVQTAARSVVALTEEKLFLKVPLIDRQNVANALQLYSDTGTGAHVRSICTTAGLEDYPVVISEYIDGHFLNTYDNITLDTLSQLTHTIRTVQPSVEDLTQYMSIEQRLALELKEAQQRMKTLDDTSDLSTLLNTIDAIQSDTTPRILCHGDVDFRNVTIHHDKLQFLDPEPVVAPIEFDVAKALTMHHCYPLEEVAEATQTNAQLLQHYYQAYNIVWRLYYRVKEQEYTSAIV